MQVLQTLSILIQNIRSQTAIFYLFSNNYINQLISTQLVCCSAAGNALCLCNCFLRVAP